MTLLDIGLALIITGSIGLLIGIYLELGKKD